MLIAKKQMNPISTKEEVEKRIPHLRLISFDQVSYDFDVEEDFHLFYGCMEDLDKGAEVLYEDFYNDSYTSDIWTNEMIVYHEQIEDEHTDLQNYFQYHCEKA